MAYDSATMREYMRAYRASGKDKWTISHEGNYRKDLPFVGIDGEGGTIAETGYHAYFLLSVGHAKLTPRSGEVRLRTVDVLRFLAELPRDSIYVGYFFDYDVTKILEDIPFDKLARLMFRSKRTRKDGKGIFPIDFAGFELDYLPRKEFKIRRKGEKSWLVINDVGSFFQCRFVEALEKWGIGTPEERELIARGKEARGSFDYADIEEIAEYNAMEIKLLQELMDSFRNACHNVGLLPKRWQGPGLLAESMFAKYRVPFSREVSMFKDERFTNLLTFASNAFYGGRPEISTIGPVPLPVWQWDINSAYPYAMQFVPCLIHGQWRNLNGIEYAAYKERYPESIALLYGAYSYESLGQRNPPQFFGFPFRSKQGTITYPACGKGWYWSFEAESAIHQTFHVDSAWLYEWTCDCKPLGFTGSVYEQRKRMGKDGPGIVLKLALNSLYGKTVQSIGMPKYSNPIWGSFITAYCRKMIQDFIHASPMCKAGRCGQDVLMIATDSVCTTTDRTDMEAGEGLGEWSCESHPNGMFFVQPGLYFGTSGKAAKTRGVPRSAIEDREQDFRNAFEAMAVSRNLSDGDVWVSQQMFCGIRYSLHRRNSKLLGQWIEFQNPETGETGKRISFDWSTKRAPFPVLDPIPFIRPWLTTLPPWGDTSLETTPYGKDIGGFKIQELRSLFEAQPDWGEDVASGFVG